MYKAAVKWLIALLVVLTTGKLHAQVAYQNFTANSGLPSNEVYCAFQDKEGYMWFGTDHGIAKYNGYDFTTYTTTDGLTDNTVFQIQQDDKGRLWFLTFNGGICYYESDSFYPHPMNTDIKALFKKQMPTSWSISSDYNLWLGINDYGFYNVQKDTIERFSSIQAGKRVPAYVYIIYLKNGNYIYSWFIQSHLQKFNSNDIDRIESLKIDWSYFLVSTNNFQLIPLADESVLIGVEQKIIKLNRHGIQDEFTYDKNKRLIKLKRLKNRNKLIKSFCMKKD